MTANNVLGEVNLDPISHFDEPKVDQDPSLLTDNVDLQKPVIEPEPVKPKTSTNSFKPIEGSNYNLNAITQNLLNVGISDKELSKILLIAEGISKKKDLTDGERALLSAFAGAVSVAGDNLSFEDLSEFYKNDSIAQSVVGPKNNSLRIKRVIPKLAKNSATLSGQDALRFIRSKGLGISPCSIPLWDSGFTVSMDSIGENEFLDLAVFLTVNTVELGRETRGAIFTGDDIHAVWPIVDFLLLKITETSIDDNELPKGLLSALDSLILVTDIESLLAGALAIMYPQGYPVYHVCVNHIKDKCNHVIESQRDPETNDFLPDSLLDFTTVMHIRSDCVTMEDTMQLSAPANSLKLANLNSYKLRKIDTYRKRYKTDSVVIIDNDRMTLSVHFEVPTIGKYRKESINWINTVKRKTDDVLTLDSEFNGEQASDRRLSALKYESRILRATKHLAWISHLALYDKESDASSTITDASDIALNLSAFANDDDVIDKIESALTKFKGTFRTSLPGFQNFACPVCKLGQVEDDALEPSVTPLNLISYFFTILSWKAASLGPIQ